MKKVWDKLADIATWIFGVAMGLIMLGMFIFWIWTILMSFWPGNKFVFGILLFILICGLIAVIDWLIENL